MESKGDKTSKKFSFRKRRSSKGRKDGEVQQPVDLVTEQNEANFEGTPEKASVVVEQETQTPQLDCNRGTESSGEDPSPKSSANAGKKKSKRRSLFKRNSKKSSADESCELTAKERENFQDKSEATEQNDEIVDSSVDNVSSSVEQGQVVCGEHRKAAEVTAEQSDGEGYFSVGEISEAEGETLLGEGSESSPETGKTEPDKGTKRKKFFKRGLSLKRRKSKKQTSEPTEGSATLEQTYKDETETKSVSQNSESAIQDQGVTEIEELTAENGQRDKNIIDESTADGENTSDAGAKKDSGKQPRKVSFVGPDGTKLESSDDGDSLTEQPVENGVESDGDTITGEDGPSQVSEEIAEIVVEEVVVMTENAECCEPLTEGDDDDLTEVSSMASDLLLSSDAPDTISTSDTSRLFTLTDTDDTGSRITLEGISEESEAEGKSESTVDEGSGTHFKTEVESDEIQTKSKTEGTSDETETKSKPEIAETEFELRPQPSDLATMLLSNGDISKIGEWEMVSRSNDMSVELSRVRKQTLFSVKRLCCSVM